MRIDETLHYVSQLTVPEEKSLEVLVINNNSTDNTVELAERKRPVFESRKISFRIIDEPRPGLSVARKTGVDAATHDTVIFCDDDNHLDSKYLVSASNVLERHRNVAIVGGYARPKFSTKNREWLKDFFPAMAIGPQGKTDGYVTWVYGAGMVLRKEIFKNLESKNIKFLLSDRSGKALMSGGDAEICGLATFLGYKIYYASTMVLYHDIPAQRLRRQHYLKAKVSTIAPSAYLFLLEQIIGGNTASPSRLYLKKLGITVKLMAYFFPRMFLGRHQFYSLFMEYRMTQTLVWLLCNPRQFWNFFEQILVNLSIQSDHGKTSTDTAVN